MTALLPIRFPPADGEAVTSWAGRLAAANGLTPSTLWARPLASRPTLREVTHLATAAGITTADVRAATPFHYPTAVTGTKAKHSGGWLLNTPPCVPLPAPRPPGSPTATGSLALHPVCSTCGVLLTRETHEDSRRRRPVPCSPSPRTWPPWPKPRDHPRVRPGRGRGGCAACAPWCPRPSTTSGRPPPATTPPRCAPPPSSPRGVVARTPTPPPSPRCCSPSSTPGAAPPGRLPSSAEGWERLRSRQLEVTHGAPSHFPKHPAALTSSTTPANPTTERWRPDGFTREAADRLAWVRRKVDQLRRTHGLAARHVPALLFLPGEDPLPPGALWRDRAEAAIALHMLLDTHPSGRVGSAASRVAMLSGPPAPSPPASWRASPSTRPRARTSPTATGLKPFDYP